jgi:RNA polymerase sigma-70 factor (ECF subfamily)
MSILTQPVWPAPNPDQQLAQRILRGERSAFEQLMRQNNQTLFRTARAILRDDAEAEDALQDAYLRAYRSMDLFRGEAKLSTWLVRIVANEALARRRRHERRASIVPISAVQGGIENHAPARAEDRPHDQAERRDIRRLLEQKIDRLPDGYREVFVLRALEELSVEETAANLGIPEATVRSRFFRARSLLREALSQEIDTAFNDAFAFLGERCDRMVARVLAKLS